MADPATEPPSDSEDVPYFERPVTFDTEPDDLTPVASWPMPEPEDADDW